MDSGKKLKDLREQFGLSQAELASRTGMSQPVIGKIEAGIANISKTAAIKLSAFFNVPIETFLTDTAPQRTIIDNDLMIDIVDAVTEFLHENNLDISPDQRRELIKHFYGQNCHDVNRIREILSGMLALNSHAFGKEK